MSHVVLLNVHGGFPSSMIERGFCELESFAFFEKAQQTEPNVRTYHMAYPTNVCAGPALHDVIMDAPIGSMTDSVWHDWAHTQTVTRSIFHIFKQKGYSTRLFGAFGLDKRLDPHCHMHCSASHLSHVLKEYGIDECDSQDAAFTCQLAFAHDSDVLRRALDFVKTLNSDTPYFVMINLLGCQDMHKCTFQDVDPTKSTVPVMQIDQNVAQTADERTFSKNVIYDDPRDDAAPSSSIQVVKRSAQLHDWIRGCKTSEGVARHTLVKSIVGLHDFCWKCLRQIDSALMEMIRTLEQKKLYADTTLYVYSDHAISIYEHGEVCEMPWEACLRTFWIRKARSDATVETKSKGIVSLSCIPSALMEDCSLFADWHTQPSLSDCVLTLGLAVSWLARAAMKPAVSPLQLQTFFVRGVVFHNYRYYAVVVWFGLTHLLHASNIEVVDGSALESIWSKQSTWENPTLGTLEQLYDRGHIMQVYEHVDDPYEMKNIAQDLDWIRGTTARLIKNRFDAAIRHHRLTRLTIKIPNNVAALGPDRVTFCSVQLHHRVRDRVNPLAEVAAPIRMPINLEKETQTIEPNLTDLLSQCMPARAVPAFVQQHKMVRSMRPLVLTLFSPTTSALDSGSSHWPEWVAAPVFGAYTDLAILSMAQRKVNVLDIKGHQHMPTYINDDERRVYLNRSVVLLKTMRLISNNQGCCIVCYNVTRRNEDAGDPIAEHVDKSDKSVGLTEGKRDRESKRDKRRSASETVETTKGLALALERRNLHSMRR